MSGGHRALDRRLRQHDPRQRPLPRPSPAAEAPGGQLQLSRSCAGSTRQRWAQGTDGELVNPASGLCVTDPGSSRRNGTVPTMGACRTRSVRTVDAARADGPHRARRLVPRRPLQLGRERQRHRHVLVQVQRVAGGRSSRTAPSGCSATSVVTAAERQGRDLDVRRERQPEVDRRPHLGHGQRTRPGRRLPGIPSTDRRAPRLSPTAPSSVASKCSKDQPRPLAHRVTAPGRRQHPLAPSGGTRRSNGPFLSTYKEKRPGDPHWAARPFH